MVRRPRRCPPKKLRLRGLSRRELELSFPVSPSRRADEKAQAAHFGLVPGSDKLPPQAELISTDPGAAALRGRQDEPGEGADPGRVGGDAP